MSESYVQAIQEMMEGRNMALYQLNGLPANLAEPRKNRAAPVFALLGLHNRESRKQFDREWRRRCKPGNGTSEEGSVLGSFRQQSARLFAFWSSKKNWSVSVRDGNYFEAYGLSILHSLMAKFDRSAFDHCYTDELADSFLQAGININKICVDLKKSLGDNFDKNRLGFINIWPTLTTELKAWDSMPPNQREDVANAIFALASALDYPWFLDEAVKRCPDLAPYFNGLNDDGGPDSDLQIAEAEADAEPVRPMSEKTPEEGVAGENWMTLVHHLNALVMRMTEDGPSQSLVNELHDLAERFDQVPLPSLVTIEEFLERLNELFNHFEHGENAAHFVSIMEDLRQILARWELLAREVDAAALADLFEDLGRRAAEAEPHEADYINAAQHLAETVKACEEAQRRAASAPLAKRAALRDNLKSAEERRDEVHDHLTSSMGALFASLNFKGEAFDATIDWKGQLAVYTGATEAQGTATAVPQFAPNAEEASPPAEVSVARAAPAGEAVLPEESATSVEPLAVAAMPGSSLLIGAAPEGSAPLRALATSEKFIPVAKSEELRSVPAISADETPQSSPVPACFWSFVEVGEYGLAFNLTEAAGPIPGLPTPNVARLLVLGVELLYPQGPIARALEDVVATVDASKDLAELSGKDALAGNLLLVAATVRSGLLAPDTGATVILHHQVSLGSGWDHLHQLIKLIEESAHQMHGAILGPDDFRERAADKTVEMARDALREEAAAWLDANSKSRLSFQAATNLWHEWVGKGGRVFELLVPIVEPGRAMTAEWQQLLAALADPDEVEKQVQESDRKLRGNRYGNIDYKALDQLKRRVDEAVRMVRSWTSIKDAVPRSAFVDRAIKALDQGLDRLKPLVMAEIENGLADEAPAVRAAAACLRREVIRLYELFDPAITVVGEERPPIVALNARLLMLPKTHLDPTGHPRSTKSELVEALLGYVPGSTTASAAVVCKMNEGNFEGAQRLIEQAQVTDEEEGAALTSTLEERLVDARAGLRNQHADTARRLESAFRSGLVSGADRDSMASDLADMEAQFKEIRRIDLGRAKLEGIVERITRNSDARLAEVRERLIQLALDPADSRYVEVNRLLSRCDALAAEEYVDHVARGVEPPSGQHADDEPPAFGPFLDSLGGLPLNLPEIETVLRQGKEWKGLSFDTLSEAARQDAISLLATWNAVKRLKRGAAEPSFEPEQVVKLVAALGFQLGGKADVSMTGRTTSRLDLNVKVQPLADRRVCPVPEFGSEAKGQYRVVCFYPKTSELEATEITPAPRGTPVATIVLFMSTLSREGRQKLLRQNLQARRSWLVIDESIVLFLTLQAQGRLRAMFAATLPYTVTDPYRIKQAGAVPAEMFYGRLSEREAIIGPLSAATVFGGRQLGKTAALKEIERQLHNPTANCIVQWVDLPGHGVGRSCRPETMWTIVVRELHRFGVVSIDWPEFKPGDQKHVARVTEDIRNWLDERPDGRILLLLDEADEFLREDATEDYPVTRQLKALMERTAGRFKTVFVGLHNVLRSTLAPNNPLVHLGAVEIGPLYAHGESQAAFEMVRGPFAALGYIFADDSLIMRILAACNYYPNLITLFCRKLLEKLRSRAEATAIDPVKGPRSISEQLVSEVYESSSLRDEIRHYFMLTLRLDTRYELIANWLAMEYLQKRMTSTEGMAALDIRAGARSIWPDGFRATTDQEFDALLMEMVGLGVLRRTSANMYSFRNPNVLQLMGTAAEIDERLMNIAVDGELKPGFDAVTFRGPMTTTARDARRSPLTIAQENQIYTNENDVLVVCGAPLHGLSDVTTVLESRHSISNVVRASGLVADAAMKELENLRAKPKPGINVFVVPDTRPWGPEWLTRFRDKITSRVSTTTWIKVVFEAGPTLLWSLAKEGALDKLGKQDLIVLKPWTDPYLWIWLEEMNLPPERALRKKVMEATDGRPELLIQLHPELDAGPHLQERIDQFIAGLAAPERAKAILADLGVSSGDVRKGLALMNEMPQETLAEISNFWPELGPAGMPLESFVRCAEMLSLVRQAGPERWEVEPFVGKLLRAAAE